MSAAGMALRARETAPGPSAVPETIALYIHWPFCRAKCPYCDFNSHVRDAIDQTRWRRALLTALDAAAEATAGRRLTSIFFGGGTPSTMECDSVAALIARAGTHWRPDEDIEITLEANPTSAEAERFRAYAAAGVNRISLGLQALDDRSLAGLGRQHSAAEGLRALEAAQCSVGRVSADLIYARPGQTPDQWRDELARALSLGLDHLSLYQLTIEKGTDFHAAWRRGELTIPGEHRGAVLFEITRSLTAEAGLPAYEISNHARAGFEGRHNLTYWRCGDYLGIGPGAHGRLTLAGPDGAPGRFATREPVQPEAWLAAAESAERRGPARQALDAGEVLSELLLMGLRLSEGIPRARFRAALGAEPEALLDQARLEALLAAGYLVWEGEWLRASGAGSRRLNALLAYLLA